MNFKEIDTEPSRGKMMDFDYYEEYLSNMSNKIMEVLRKYYYDSVKKKNLHIQLTFAH